MIKLYGVSASPFVRKALTALHCKQIPFEQINQMPFARDAEYQKISPLGKIPALQDGDVTLCDSSVICEYLEDKYPEPPLYPADAADKGRARWLEELGDSRLAELASGIFFQRFMRPMAFKQEPDEVLIEKIITVQLPPLLDYVEQQVPEQGFIFGHFCIADLSLVSSFINASYAGYEIDAQRWPRFAAFAQRVREHEVVSKLLTAEAAALGIKK